MDKESFLKSFHLFILREIQCLTDKISKEVVSLRHLRGIKDIAFKDFKRDLAVSDLRVFVIMEQFAALEGQCATFDEELNCYLLSMLTYLDTSVQGVWFGSAASRFQCLERIDDYKIQLMEAMNEISKIYAELIILHDHLTSFIDKV